MDDSSMDAADKIFALSIEELLEKIRHLSLKHGADCHRIYDILALAYFAKCRLKLDECLPMEMNNDPELKSKLLPVYNYKIKDLI